MIWRSFLDELQDRLEKPKAFIQVVIGPRQVGKTTGMRQLVEEWSGSALYVTADEQEKPDSDWLTLQWERAKYRGKGTLLIVDEIQKVSDWSRTIKLLFDQDRHTDALRVVVLGSASLRIQKGLSDSLAGRYELIEVPHWSYQEMQKAFNWSLREYVTYGGYPGAASLIERPARWQAFMRDAVIEPVVNQDLLSTGRVNNPALFRQTFDLVMRFPCQEISLQKLLGQLQENGNVSTIKHYLDLFEGAFLLKSLHKYTGGVLKPRLSSPKLLPLTTALPQGLHDKGPEDDNPEWYGRLFETMVGAHLSRLSRTLFYWRERNVEVDFVIPFADELYAIEVKSTRKATLKGLQAFKKQYPKAIPIVINQDNIEEFLATTSVLQLKGF